MWFSSLFTVPKIHRHSLGQKIDNLFVETIEAVAAASFSAGTEKMPYIRHAIKKMDTLKLFLMILWETKSLDNKKYLALSVKLDEIGRMLGGWRGQLLKKQNSPHQ